MPEVMRRWVLMSGWSSAGRTCWVFIVPIVAPTSSRWIILILPLLLSCWLAKLVLQVFLSFFFGGVPHIAVRLNDAASSLSQLDFVFRETMGENHLLTPPPSTRSPLWPISEALLPE